MESDNAAEDLATTNKKACTGSSTAGGNLSESTVSMDHILNFPLPGRPGKVCHVRMYTETEDLKLNDLCEFVGFISFNPILSYECYQLEEFDNPAEVQTHNPPPSVVPRIHCVGWKKLKHCNPLVGAKKFSNDRMMYLKGELLVVLTQILLGDKLAAEYLLYHLISNM